MTPDITPTFDRDQSFSFACARCSRCCHHKGIKVNPYEVWRLSRALGMDTTRFLASHTQWGGTFLRFDPNGTCPFLGPEGCRVHADRPLVCRLYPLARRLNGQAESFWLGEREPGCQAVTGGEGTVSDYLAGQGALEFMDAADRYLALYRTMAQALDQAPAATPIKAQGEGLEQPPSEESPHPWLDIDAAYAAHGMGAAPDGPGQALAWHLDWLARRIARAGGES